MCGYEDPSLVVDDGTAAMDEAEKAATLERGNVGKLVRLGQRTTDDGRVDPAGRRSCKKKTNVSNSVPTLTKGEMITEYLLK